jgi:hypothetical protein
MLWESARMVLTMMITVVRGEKMAAKNGQDNAER